MGHKLQKQQTFLKNYINPITHYKNLLIFHGTGAGKTCSAISIAENHLNYDNTKKVILLAPGDTIYMNLKKELYNYQKKKKKKIKIYLLGVYNVLVINIMFLRVI